MKGYVFMAQFEPGKIINTVEGMPVKIVKYIAGGGQGDVYMVDYKGVSKALKWYKNVGKEPDAFYNNLKRNIEKGAPSESFLWPEAITEKTEGSFGYIMDLRPPEYHELSEFMIARDVRFSSFKASAEACINIANAFRLLHNYGMSYQDLNDGNFFIDPNTGKVLICDNDNVAANGKNTGIIGKPRYMAPEIVLGKALPDTQTDRFSLAVILFIVLFNNHPLEGRKSLVPCLTPQIAEKLYGSEALFIYDEKDHSNEPVNGSHTNVINRWGFMPDYIKAAFTKAFSQDAIQEPGKRLRELDWLRIFVRFRSDIVKCSCGNEIFINNASSTKCDSCGKIYEVNHKIKLPDYCITAARGSRIYRCQLGSCNAEDALDPAALVVAKPSDPNTLGLKNMTKETLDAKTPSGKEKHVAAQEVIPFVSGIKLDIFDTEIELI